MIRNQRDFYAGLLFAAFGVAALIFAQTYPIGTAARMGPGYFPRLLGIVLVAGGALQAFLALRTKSEGPLVWHWRPLFVLLIGVAAFIVATPFLGMVVSAFALVVISSAASREFRWRPALLAGAIQGVAAAALFIYGLGVPLPVWPVFLSGG